MAFKGTATSQASSKFGTTTATHAWESTRLTTKDGWVVDPQNRVVILHGLNVSGGTKMPFSLAAVLSGMEQESGSGVAKAASATKAATKTTTKATASNFGLASSATPTTPTTTTGAKPNSSDGIFERDGNKGEIPGVVYSYKEENFFDHRSVSFVNRPFPLEDADEHFARLARWGCQCLRVLVPWEALEHSGPGIYDEDYIDYLIKLLRIAAKHGLKCFLDPHVDCWSRFTGGSGMPGWTIELAGLDVTKLDEVGAAEIQNVYHDKKDYPKMIWATNSSKVAASTMYTLFFAGQVFAPQAMVPLTTTVLAYLRKIHGTIIADEAYRRGVPGGAKSPSPVQNLIPIPRSDHAFIEKGQVNIQHFLQGHFMEAFAYLAKRVHDQDMEALSSTISSSSTSSSNAPTLGLISSGTVMGFDTLNEPSPGFLHYPDLNKLLELSDLHIGECPTPFQGIQLAQGRTVECQVWDTGAMGPLKKGKAMVNPNKINIWQRPYWKSADSTNTPSAQPPLPPLPQSSSPTFGVPRIHRPSAPPLHTRVGYSPDEDEIVQEGSSPGAFDFVSQLGIAAARSAFAGSGPGQGPTTLAEGRLAKTGWPQPSGYTDQCLWAQHGVWDPEKGTLLRPDYFARIPDWASVPAEFQPGQEIEWKRDFWLPFVNSFSLRLRLEDVRFTMFVEPPINEAPPMFRLKKILLGSAGDQIRHMLKAIVRWRPNQDPPSSESRRAGSSGGNGTVNSRQGTNRTSTEDHPEKCKPAPRRPEDDLLDNACQHPNFDPIGDVSDNVVVAPHFYDGYANVTRDFIPCTIDYLGYKRGLYWSAFAALKLGWSGVSQAWRDQVHGIQSDIRFAMGHQHGILMGETGIPIDMHKKASFLSRYGNPKQSYAMGLLLDAMDASMMNYTLWNYCPDNSHFWGDRWNGEDFSVWSSPENGFLDPDLTPPNTILSATATSNLMDSLGTAVPARPGITLTEITSEYRDEVVGCREGCIWWTCLPSSHVWTRRTAPRSLVVLAVDPAANSGSTPGSTSMTSISTAAAASSSPTISSGSTVVATSPSTTAATTTAKPRIPQAWQDLLPLSVQIERGLLEFYGGLRVGETFVRAYPLAIWGEPISYHFEPGKPILSSSDLTAAATTKGVAGLITNDVPAFENRFRMVFRLDCGRCPRRPDSSGNGGSSSSHSTGAGHPETKKNNEDTTTKSHSTDVFLPRYHFALDSPVGQAQFESLQIRGDEIQRKKKEKEAPVGPQSNESSQSSTAENVDRTVVSVEQRKEKGRWHYFDVQVTDGSYTLDSTRQLLQYWTDVNTTPTSTERQRCRGSEPNPMLDDNLASTTAMMDKVEARLRALFAQGWDGREGITTSVEQEWTRKLWQAVKRGDATADQFVSSSGTWWGCCLSSSGKWSKVEQEERRKLKLKELQQQWRERVGLPAKGAAICRECGQLEVMHLHGVQVRLQMWSGYRGLH